VLEVGTRRLLTVVTDEWLQGHTIANHRSDERNLFQLVEHGKGFLIRNVSATEDLFVSGDKVLLPPCWRSFRVQTRCIRACTPQLGGDFVVEAHSKAEERNVFEIFASVRDPPLNTRGG
jgi:hypothetical protein